MKYRCEICGYIYDPTAEDMEYEIEAGVDFNELYPAWVCPRCGIEKDQFHLVEGKKTGTEGEGSMALMILALTNGLWTISGRGSYSVTREIGRVFINELKKEDVKFKESNSSLESVKEYFIRNKFAGDIHYNLTDDGAELEIKNCRFFGICKQLENEGVLITTCPYTNTASMAMEESTGYRYRINKEQEGYGHRIKLTRLSKI